MWVSHMQMGTRAVVHAIYSSCKCSLDMILSSPHNTPYHHSQGKCFSLPLISSWCIPFQRKIAVRNGTLFFSFFQPTYKTMGEKNNRFSSSSSCAHPPLSTKLSLFSCVPKWSWSCPNTFPVSPRGILVSACLR